MFWEKEKSSEGGSGSDEEYFDESQLYSPIVSDSDYAEFYDDEVDQAVENLTAMIEPVMLVFLGTVIGGLVVAMYLPVFKMAGAIQG